MTSNLDEQEEEQSSLNIDVDSPDAPDIEALDISTTQDDHGAPQSAVDYTSELASESSEEDAWDLLRSVDGAAPSLETPQCCQRTCRQRRG